MKNASQSSKSPVVFVVDDEAVVRESLSRFLESYGFRTEGFESGEAFLERLPISGPGCILLDIQMPGISGLELQEALVSRNVRLPIIFLTSHGDVPSCASAMKNGAQEFFSKLEDETVLMEAIDKALERSKELVRVLSLFDGLTERELQTCRHVIAGSLNKQIGDVLGIAERTVKSHRSQLMEKTGVESVAELVRLAEKAGIEPAAKWGEEA